MLPLANTLSPLGRTRFTAPGGGGGPSTLLDGLIAWYQFEGDLTDSSGNGNDASFFNGGGFTTGATGGLAVDLGGGFHLLSPPTGPTGPEGTIAFWMQPYTDGVTRGVFDSGCFLRLGTDYLTLGFHGGSGFSWPITYAAGEWHHVSITWEAGDCTVSVDGAFVMTEPDFIPAYGGGTNWGIDDTGLFNGAFDEIRFYDRALTSDEAAELYAYAG